MVRYISAANLALNTIDGGMAYFRVAQRESSKSVRLFE
jgi:hypothetical protein